MDQKQQEIVRIVYRRYKGLELTRDEWALFTEWISNEGNRKLYIAISDPEERARLSKIYFAPGKEEGLRQLRKAINADRPIKEEGNTGLLFWLGIVWLVIVALFAFWGAFTLLIK